MTKENKHTEKNDLEENIKSYEYFKSKTHIKDLQKLKDDELFFFIAKFTQELKNFNETPGFNLRGLIKTSEEMKELINKIRFILNSYTKHLHLCPIIETQNILNFMDKMKIDLKNLKSPKILKKNEAKLWVRNCLILNVRVLYKTLSDLIILESEKE